MNSKKSSSRSQRVPSEAMCWFACGILVGGLAALGSVSFVAAALASLPTITLCFIAKHFLCQDKTGAFLMGMLSLLGAVLCLLVSNEAAVNLAAHLSR